MNFQKSLLAVILRRRSSKVLSTFLNGHFTDDFLTTLCQNYVAVVARVISLRQKFYNAWKSKAFVSDNQIITCHACVMRGDEHKSPSSFYLHSGWHEEVSCTTLLAILLLFLCCLLLRWNVVVVAVTVVVGAFSSSGNPPSFRNVSVKNGLG